MSCLILRGLDAVAAEAALYGDVSDPVALMEKAGCDTKIFFEYGNWNGVDFTKSNLDGVSFRGAEMAGAIITDFQLQQIGNTHPKSLPNSTAAIEGELAQMDIFASAEEPLDVSAQTIEDTTLFIDDESLLIGFLLSDNENYYKISDLLKLSHFNDAFHGEVFDTISKTIRSGKDAKPATITTIFPEQVIKNGMHTQSYLSKVTRAAENSDENVIEIAKRIIDQHTRQNFTGLGEDILKFANGAALDKQTSEQIANIEKRLHELVEQHDSDSGFKTFDTAMSSALDMAAAAYQRDGGLSGISTGIYAIDKKMGGLQPSDLIVIAGHEGIGKTSLATTIAFEIASKHALDPSTGQTIEGGIVGYFSLVTSAEQLATRIMSEQAEVPVADIRQGNISESDFEKLTIVTEQMARIPLYIDETGNISINQVATRARQLKRNKGLDLLVIDHVQVLLDLSDNSDGRDGQLVNICSELKSLARELNIPIIVLSQLAEGNSNRPISSRFRLNSSLEKAADVVLFLHREDFHLENEEPELGSNEWSLWDEKISYYQGKADLIIAKQRHGPTGTIKLEFNKNWGRFSDPIEN